MNETKSPGSFSRLMNFAKPHQGMYIASVIFAVIGVASGMVPYFSTAQMILRLISGGKDWNYYLLWCCIAAGGFTLKVLCMNISTTFSHKATYSVISEIRLKMADKLTRVPMGFLMDTPSGKLKATMVERVDSMELPLAHLIPEMTANLLIPVVTVAYIFLIDWRMALVSLITIPIGGACYMAMMKNYPEKYGASVQAAKHMSGTTVEYINGIEVIKAFNQSAASYGKFSDAVYRYRDYMLDWAKSTQGYSIAALTIWPAVLLGILPIGCLLSLNGSLAGSDFITIIILGLGIIGPLVAAMMFTDDIAKISTVIGDLSTILDIPDLERPAETANLTGHDIELKNVSFAYKDVLVLNRISLDIRAGQVTSFVGPSGSGKSTIAKLIASFWETQSGTLTIGGIDIRKIPLEQVNGMIAYVSQDNYLFNDTVRNNIRMGNLKASDKEVEAVAKASGCYDFIMGLENGFETIVGGSGGHLSGGERQRIAIARAMLKNAPIVILDEATAYLDPENEAILQSAISNLVEGKTLIVIAHRLSTITHSDRIVVIESGKIVGQGKHEELRKDCPLYEQMWTAHIGTRDQVEGGI